MDLGVYVHFPFCRVRCPYCDFVTTDREDLARLHRAGHAATLGREWDLRRERHPEIAGAHLRSVFFGGGTPNLMTPDEVGSLVGQIRSSVGSETRDLEVTLEMNPGISDREAMLGFREAGVSRASLGVQSTHDRLLDALGRDHSAADARNALEAARAAGFANVNVDLIFAVPGQTLADWEAALREVIAWEPDHVSAYNLTAKDQTPFAAAVRRGEVALPGEEESVAMFEAGHALLTEAGFEHYEISNFARPGRRCVHNGDVWRGAPYLGIGLGAHSCLADERFANTAAWEEYHREIRGGHLPSRIDERDAKARLMEELYLGLRTREGVDLGQLGEHHGCDLRVTRRLDLSNLIENRLAELGDRSLCLTLRGWGLADAIVADLT